MDKTVVEGSVTYNGTPIVNGEILFYPVEDTIGPVSGAAIAEGKYRIDGKGGVPVGQHVVKIEAFLASPSDQGDMISIASNLDSVSRKNFIPPKYNERSDLFVEIESSRSAVTRDFNLTK